MLAGQPIVYPRNDLTYSENILHMMFGLPTERYEVDPVLSKALEAIIILHMDHEQNASTSTVRVAGMSPRVCCCSVLWLYISRGGCQTTKLMFCLLRTCVGHAYHHSAQYI